MRNWKPFLAVLLVLSLALAACGGDDDDDDADLSPEEAQAALCTNLEAFRAEVDELRDTSSDATIEDLQGAREPLQDAFADVEEAADDVQDAEIQELEDAYNALYDILDELDEETPVPEAVTAIQGGVDGVVAGWQEIFDVAECGS